MAETFDWKAALANATNQQMVGDISQRELNDIKTQAMQAGVIPVGASVFDNWTEALAHAQDLKKQGRISAGELAKITQSAREAAPNESSRSGSGIGQALLNLPFNPLLLGAAMNAQQPGFPQAAPQDAPQDAPQTAQRAIYRPHDVLPLVPAPPQWMQPVQEALRAGIRPLQNGLNSVGSQIFGGPRPAY